MRVGSTHKVKEITSPVLKRRLTGSKGVGRLAVQFLASELEVVSVPSSQRSQQESVLQELFAMVDWDTAVEAGELTRATALYELRQIEDTLFPLESPHGTTITMRNLKHEWSPEEFEDLAREIWFLQPPFRSLTGVSETETNTFEVHLYSSDPDSVALFNTQIARILELYTSRLVGRLLPSDDSDSGARRRLMQLSLDLERQPTTLYELSIPVRGEGPCLIDSLDFEIRIFNLQHRQPYRIPVQQARDYMREWGGVHIYDAGFRIPYAGAGADWLNLEFDHAHRLTQSQLLPAELNIHMGLSHLPTNSRVLGVVNIDTSREARAATRNNISSGRHLQIQVSRDRLVGNAALHQLRDAVRFALDYYATRLAALRHKEETDKRKIGASDFLVSNVWQVLEKHEETIPETVASELRTELDKTIDTLRDQAEWTRSQAGLLGAMATVGSTAIAFDHQLNQQLSILEFHASSLDNIIEYDPRVTAMIEPISADIKNWVQGVRETRAIFSPISDERNRTSVARFKAQSLIQTMANNMRPLLRGVSVDVTKVDEAMLLPEASYPIWMAIFHNLLLNASNAMLDSAVKHIAVCSLAGGARRAIRVSDTGVGIDLKQSENLFVPLNRGLEISAERRALGYGGTGLGLAIVRMLATDLGADVRFVRPRDNFSTCFELAWRED